MNCGFFMFKIIVSVNLPSLFCQKPTSRNSHQPYETCEEKSYSVSLSFLFRGYTAKFPKPCLANKPHVCKGDVHFLCSYSDPNTLPPGPRFFISKDFLSPPHSIFQTFSSGIHNKKYSLHHNSYLLAMQSDILHSILSLKSKF